MWIRIEVKTVVIIPNNGLYAEREGAKMTLMCYGSNKLHGDSKLISLMNHFLKVIESV